MDTTPQATAGPVHPGERIQTIDMLRGFALLGILLVNMTVFNNTIYTAILTEMEFSNLADRLAFGLIAFFAEGKFYSLFAFLFGLGFAIIYQRIEKRGLKFGPIYLRRMLTLLIFGLIHAYLIWVGDILILYSLLGFILLLFFRKARPKTLVVWAVICLLLPLLLNAAIAGLLALANTSPEGAAVIDAQFGEQTRIYASLAAQADQVYASGTYAEITAQRAVDMNAMFGALPFMGFNVLAMMLLGVWAGKVGIFANIPAHLPRFRRWLVWGLVIGVPGNLIYVIAGEYSNRAVPDLINLIAVTGQTFGAPALAFFYLSALTLLAERPAWKQRLAPLAAAGRMAISNYLMQSILCTLLFYGYGFGLYGIGAALGILVTIAILTIEMLWSPWWLARFRFGPVEWLWRTVTYWKRQPMRQ
ncbi:MAG: DUF418 domain-containing protein [Anaerolineales bacterium]|nr:DUF418 domain-containing protein [Anaerolineales bacterium]